MEDATFQEARRLLVIELEPVRQRLRLEEDEEEDGATPVPVTPIPLEPMDIFNVGTTAMEAFGGGAGGLGY